MKLKKTENTEKGVTLISLIAYIGVFMIIITIMTTISTFFYSNLNSTMSVPQYASEFNKFTMFFVYDIKNNNDATVTSNRIEFENGAIYEYRNNCIYRDDVLIAENVLECTFTKSEYNVNTITKNIINTNLIIGKNDNTFSKNIDFVLKYW